MHTNRRRFLSLAAGVGLLPFAPRVRAAEDESRPGTEERDYKISKPQLAYLSACVRKLQTLTKKICRKEMGRLRGAES